MKVPYQGPEPRYMSRAAGGADLVYPGTPYSLPPGSRKLLNTWTRVAIPEGYVGMVCPRSGLALKYGITVLNAPGIVDSDYRGPIGVCLVNHGPVPYVVQSGDRIAQLLIVPVERAIFEPIEVLDETTRGEAGWGST